MFSNHVRTIELTMEFMVLSEAVKTQGRNGRVVYFSWAFYSPEKTITKIARGNRSLERAT